MPFIVIFVVPAALLAVYFIHRHHDVSAVLPADAVCMETSAQVPADVAPCNAEAPVTR